MTTDAPQSPADAGGIRGANPAWLRVALVALGSVLIAVTLVEMYLWWVVWSSYEMSFVTGILMSLPAAGVLVAGGYKLPETSVSEQRYSRIGFWTLGGIVVLGGFSLSTGLAFFPGIPLAQVGSVRWGVSVGAGTGFFVGFLDARTIDRAVAAERARVRAEEADHRRKLVDYMNALLRHEVLNTATVISGYTDLITSTVDDDHDAQEYGAVIERQTEELRSVIEDAQLLAEIADGEAELERVELRGVLESELANVRDRYGGVETDLDAPPAVHVQADSLVRRLFSNLLENAVKHNDSEPKRVSVSVSTAPETATVEVRDNGLGIPEHNREDLFGISIRKDSNHGLGLTIATRLTERYDGAIELAETGPDGTILAVTLPRVAVEDDVESAGKISAD